MGQALPCDRCVYTRHTAVRLGPHGTRHSAGCCPAAAPPHPPAGTRHRTPPPLPRLQQHRGEWVGGGWWVACVSGGGQGCREGNGSRQAAAARPRGASPGNHPPHTPHPHAPRTRGRIDLLDAETQNVEEAGNGHGAGRPRKHHIYVWPAPSCGITASGSTSSWLNSSCGRWAAGARIEVNRRADEIREPCLHAAAHNARTVKAGRPPPAPPHHPPTQHSPRLPGSTGHTDVLQHLLPHSVGAVELQHQVRVQHVPHAHHLVSQSPPPSAVDSERGWRGEG